MKVKRLRAVKKTLNFYKNNYSFAPPYRILVDGTFCHTALKVKVNVANELPKYLGMSSGTGAAAANAAAANAAAANDVSDTSIKDDLALLNESSGRDQSRASSPPPQYEILTTDCCLRELEKIGSPVYGALCILRQFALKPCGHVEPIPATHCLLSILKKGNVRSLFV